MSTDRPATGSVGCGVVPAKAIAPSTGATSSSLAAVSRALVQGVLVDGGDGGRLATAEEVAPQDARVEGEADERVERGVGVERRPTAAGSMLETVSPPIETGTTSPCRSASPLCSRRAGLVRGQPADRDAGHDGAVGHLVPDEPGAEAVRDGGDGHDDRGDDQAAPGRAAGRIGPLGVNCASGEAAGAMGSSFTGLSRSVDAAGRREPGAPPAARGSRRASSAAAAGAITRGSGCARRLVRGGQHLGLVRRRRLAASTSVVRGRARRGGTSVSSARSVGRRAGPRVSSAAARPRLGSAAGARARRRLGSARRARARPQRQHLGLVAGRRRPRAPARQARARPQRAAPGSRRQPRARGRRQPRARAGVGRVAGLGSARLGTSSAAARPVLRAAGEVLRRAGSAVGVVGHIAVGFRGSRHRHRSPGRSTSAVSCGRRAESTASRSLSPEPPGGQGWCGCRSLRRTVPPKGVPCRPGMESCATSCCSSSPSRGRTTSAW